MEEEEEGGGGGGGEEEEEEEKKLETGLTDGTSSTDFFQEIMNILGNATTIY